MKIARESTWAALIWIGLFVANPAMAQLPTEAPAAVPPLATQPAPEVPAETLPEQIPADKPALKPIAEEAFETPSETILTETDPLSVFNEDCSGGVCLSDGGYGVSDFGPCCAVCGGGSCCPPNWYTEQHVRLWARGRPRRHALTSEFDIQQFNIGDDDEGNEQRQNFRVVQQRMNTRSVNFGPSTAWETVFGRYLGRDAENRDHFLEFGFSLFGHWRESLELQGTRVPIFDREGPYDPDDPSQIPEVVGYTGSLLSAFPELAISDVGATPTEALLSDVFNRVDRHTQVQESDIDSFEVNLRLRPRGRGDRLVLHPNGKWRRECTPGEYVSYLFGLRVISVDEKFQFLARGTRRNVNLEPTAYTNGEYRIRTYNDMIGLQFGGDWTFRKCKWTYGVRAKMGPMINFTSKDAQIYASYFDAQGLTETTLAASGRKNSASLLGEVGFTGSYRIYPNVTLQASYDFMWLVGLALAPEQLLLKENIVKEVNDNGHIYYHGLTLGAEFTF